MNNFKFLQVLRCLRHRSIAFTKAQQMNKENSDNRTKKISKDSRRKVHRKVRDRKLAHHRNTRLGTSVPAFHHSLNKVTNQNKMVVRTHFAQAFNDGWMVSKSFTYQLQPKSVYSSSCNIWPLMHQRISLHGIERGCHTIIISTFHHTISSSVILMPPYVTFHTYPAIR